jgi:hypothetical protein
MYALWHPAFQPTQGRHRGEEPESPAIRFTAAERSNAEERLREFLVPLQRLRSQGHAIGKARVHEGPRVCRSHFTRQGGLQRI